MCVGWSGDTDGVSLLLPQEPRSITSSPLYHQPPSQRLAVAFKAGEAGGQEAVGGRSCCGVGSCLGITRLLPVLS